MSADVGELSGLGLLTWVYPSGLVDRAVAACGRAEQRRRLLLARLMVYFVLGLALFSPAPYLDVMRHLVEGLRGQGLLGDWHVPAKSSLFRARQLLGPEPLRVLFTTTAKPMGTESTPGAFWRGLRLLAVDGTCWDVADSLANEAAFGRPGNSRGHDKSSFPQVRMACLIEVGTHLVPDAEPAGCRTGEVTLVGRLPRSCGPGQLGLADREFLGVPLWRAFTATGADLLWSLLAQPGRIAAPGIRLSTLAEVIEYLGVGRLQDQAAVSPWRSLMPTARAVCRVLQPGSCAVTPPRHVCPISAYCNVMKQYAPF
ncbi:IS4 family transposase [Streptomyces sp. NPDC090088]|uniref:IS4 family transposase n=1 Tax=Streptomyces sp. NPDC090088 TaxID=3365944 RepID=UPI003804C942